MQHLKYRLLSVTFTRDQYTIPMDILFDEIYKEDYDHIIKELNNWEQGSIEINRGNLSIKLNDLSGIMWVYTDLDESAEYYGYFTFCNND